MLINKISNSLLCGPEKLKLVQFIALFILYFIGAWAHQITFIFTLLTLSSLSILICFEYYLIEKRSYTIRIKG